MNKKTFKTVLVVALVLSIVGIAWAGRRVVKDKMLFEDRQYVQKIVAKTSDYTLLATDKSKTFTNLGTTGQVTFTLPTTPESGFNAKVICADGNGYTVVVQPGTTERILALSTNDGYSVISTTTGACLAFEAVEYTTDTMGWAITSDRTGWAEP